MGIETINEILCNGCGICVDNCLADVIRMDSHKDKPYIAYQLDCAVCFQCVDECPTGAISVTAVAPRKLILPY